MTHKPKLILIDGSSFMFRSFYAPKQNFSTQDGTPTGALFIFTKMIQGLSKQFQDEKIVVVFDAKGKSFRNEMFPEYKATRPPMPDEMRVQIEPIHTLVKLMGMPLIIVPGVEADDVLGSYALEGERQGYHVIICTSDKDMAQLVNENIVLHDTMKNITYDTEGVKNKYGVYPEHIIDYLALKGDTSDNIPGMKGVGDVTASELINNIGGIYEIRKRLDEVQNLKFRGSKTFKARFEESWSDIEISYQLATIKTDVELPIKIEDLTPPVEDGDGLIALFDRYELATFSRYQRNKKLSNTPSSSGEKGSEENLLSPQITKSFKKKQSIKEAKALNNDTPILSEQFSTDAAGSSITIIQPEAQESSDNNLIAELKASAANNTYSTVDDIKTGLHIVDNEEALEELVKQINSSNRVALYTETTTEPSISDRKLVGLALSLKEGEAYYLPFRHSLFALTPQLNPQQALQTLSSVINRAGLVKIAHDVKHVRLVLSFNGLELQGPFSDPQIALHVINSSTDNDFKFMVSRYLKYHMIERNLIVEKKDDSLEMSEISDATNFCGERALLTFRLDGVMQKELASFDKAEKDNPTSLDSIAPHLSNLVKNAHGIELNPSRISLYNHEMKVLDVLYAMEKEGALVDGPELQIQAKDMMESLSVVENEIYDLAGNKFNISSPKQLSNVLFNVLNIPYPKKTKDGAKPSSYSTADDILSELCDEYEIVSKVQRFRALNKLISTYATKLPNLIGKKTGRIHTCFNLAGTITGRLSSSEPNLQNIPARTKEGRQIRSAFVAPKGYKLVSIDYSQIELRIIAHYSQDPNLNEAFKKHLDIHRVTAAEVLGKSPDMITDEERAHAKATNFGLMYGMSALGLSRQTKMPYNKAKDYIEKYFNRYPSIKELMDSIVQEAHTCGYVTTVLGSHIYINGIQSSGMLQRKAERAAINAPMQGSAADIIKKAMLDIHEYISTLDKDTVRMTIQVHDELIFEIREDILEEASAKIKEIMESAVTLTAPLEVGVGIADSWANAH